VKSSASDSTGNDPIGSDPQGSDPRSNSGSRPKRERRTTATKRAPQVDWAQLEKLLHRDPRGRGVASFCPQGSYLDTGQLAAAASSLATAKAVGIVTGFCVVEASRPAGETDGPPGALYLARALLSAGVEVTLISDSFGMPLLEAGCQEWHLPSAILQTFPTPEVSDAANPGQPSNCQPSNCQSWIDRLLTSGPGRGWTHLIAIERAGPSHTAESLAAQTRTGPIPWLEFDRLVPAESRDRCHNMRGVVIDAVTPPIHRLFETIAERRLPIRTIGIGDGGNEIGMGRVPWELLTQAISIGPGARIACRIATDALLIAGVSNWAAYALAASTMALGGRREELVPWDIENQRALIEMLVHKAGAVDGVTRLRQATVDGLPLETYLQTLAGIRQTFGLRP
jgi:hypothetical protein